MKTRFFSSVCLIVLLLCVLGSAFTASAEGSLNATVSASRVTVGQNFTLTLEYSGGGAAIGSLDAQVKYDTKVLQYVSGSDSIYGSAGILTISWYATGVTAPGSVKRTMTFKAIAAQEGTSIEVTTNALINDETQASMGNPQKTLTVSVEDPAASSNANLASLKPSSGTLTPKFNANTTSYTVEVPYTTTSLSLSAVPAEGAKVTHISGKNALAVGKNTRVITVTAPSGVTNKYTVVITRAADQGGSGETSTTVPPPGDPLEVTVGEETMQVSDTQPDTTLPLGYGWDSVTLNGTVVAAAKNADNGTVLLWLTPAAGGEGTFYLYDETSGQFTLFRPLTVDSRLYILLPMPAGQEVPTGTVAGTCSVGGQETDAFLYEDTALSDYAIVYVTAPDGRTGLYVYDSTDSSFQRYHTVTVAAQAPADDTPAAGWWQRMLTYARSHWRLLALCAAGVAVLTAVIIVTVVAVRRSHRSSGCRH